MCFGFFVVRYIRYVVTNELIFPVEKNNKNDGNDCTSTIKKGKISI